MCVFVASSSSEWWWGGRWAVRKTI